MFTATLLGNLKQKQTFSETKVENKKILSFLQNYVCDHNILKFIQKLRSAHVQDSSWVQFVQQKPSMSCCCQER